MNKSKRKFKIRYHALGDLKEPKYPMNASDELKRQIDEIRKKNKRYD